MNIPYEIAAQELPHYQLAVCGGGVAGFAAAVSAARQGLRVLLVEKSGCLGGTLTNGLVPQLLDAENKGGIVRETVEFLQKAGKTCVRKGSRLDAEGRKKPGYVVDPEACKYYFDRMVLSLGIDVLYYAGAAAVKMEGDRIRSLLVVTGDGCFSASADLYIDATGNGRVAAAAGCRFEHGSPESGDPQPTSVGAVAAGYPWDFNGTDSEAEKTRYNQMLEDHGIYSSGGQFSVIRLTDLSTWLAGGNMQYRVDVFDPFSVSRATQKGRMEAYESLEEQKKVPGNENVRLLETAAALGVREGRRILGRYRITEEDILSGARFPDGICTVCFGVDVHKLHKDDVLDNSRGKRIRPYQLPFRALVPLDCGNLLLAGRCLSGNFYPHASYRVMGNMMATGEAAGYAAALCLREGLLPAEVDGRRVRQFMADRGYVLETEE